MSIRAAVRLAAVALLALGGSAPAYIHFPPMTLPKMCKESHAVRVLKVERFDKDKGVVVFKVDEELKKGKQPDIVPSRHVVRPEATDAKRVSDWAAAGKEAVMFSIEGYNAPAQKVIGIAYVFIDDFCYTADYNASGKYWLLIRGEPGMSACYHGSATDLKGLTKDVLAGKDVKVPTKEPAKGNKDARDREVNDVLNANRKDK